MVKKPDALYKMLARLKDLLKDESGATAVEYGLIVAAIAGLIIVVVFLLGKKVNNAFSNVAQHIN
jgi:pilus assembly protein Flp/PilA